MLTRPWTTPIFRWAGSKRQLLPLLIRCIPSDMKRYVEPFAGSACLFFAVRPRKALLGDINEELFKTYSTIHAHPRLVYRAVSHMPATSRHYYYLRGADFSAWDAVTQAARFVYLNRYCFNGVYRTNLSGKFNVPRGYKTGTIPPERAFYRCAIALRGAKLRPGDFSKCLKDIAIGDFVYLDPPYATNVHRDRGEYGKGSFGPSDIRRLLNTLSEIDANGATFVLSFIKCPEIQEAMSCWFSTSVRVRRYVAGFGRHRTTVEEVLLSNRPFTFAQAPKVSAEQQCHPRSAKRHEVLRTSRS
jgi:DNA adenine methylase